MVLLAFILLIGVVNAENGWGEFTDGGEEIVPTDSEDSEVEDDEAQDLGADFDSGINAGETSTESGKSTRYTQDFYFALGGVVGALLLFLLLLFFLLKRPKNRWKKKQ